MRFFTVRKFVLSVCCAALCSQPVVAQPDVRKAAPRTGGSQFLHPKSLGAGEERIAYGLLAYDDTDINYTNGLVSFPLTGSSTLEHVRMMGDESNGVTAGAYAGGYYYVARSVSDGTYETATDLLKYDMEADQVSTVGTITGFESYVADMTFDYASHTMFAIERPVSDGTSDLRKIDLTTGESQKVADLDRRFFTLACTYAGQLYGISFEGDLCRIDKTTGAVTQIGATGLHPMYFQSMEFDHSDGTLYWAASIQDLDIPDGLAVVDTLTGKASMIGSLGDGAEIAGLYIPFSAAAAGAPAAVSGLTVTPDAGGAPQAVLQWSNPGQTFDGQPLETLSAVKVYRDKQLVATLTPAKPGASMSYTDAVGQETKGAVHHYTVVAVNAVGEGAQAQAQAFVGHDIPADVTDLTLRVDGYEKAVLSWQTPQQGANGGYVDKNSLVYEVVRQPGNTVLASALSEPAFTDQSVTEASTYSYQVKAVNADGASSPVATPSVVIGPINSMPYVCDFTSKQSPNTWTMVDADGDGSTWMWTETAGGYMMGRQPSTVQGSDDWLLSYYIPVEKGKVYRLDYSAHCYSADKLELYLLENTDPQRVVQLVKSVSMEKSEGFKTYSLLFKAASTGIYNLGLRALSSASSDWIELSKLSLREADDVNLGATALVGETSPVTGMSSDYTVTVSNLGRQRVDAYEVSLTDGEGHELAKSAISDPLESGQERQVTLSWTPADQSVTQLVAKVACEADADASDDATAPLAVEVQDGNAAPTVGIGTSSNQISQNYPFDLFNQHAAAFNLYAAEEIGHASAVITKISYPYSASLMDDIAEVPVKVYMGNTEVATTADGWLPEADLTLVYDGTIGFTKGSSRELEIPLSQPFAYDGHNLAIITVVESAKYYSGVYFKQYRSPLAGNSVYAWGDYRSTVPFDFTQTGRQDSYGYTSSVTLYLEQSTGIGQTTAVPPLSDYELYDLTGRKVSCGTTSPEGKVDRSSVRPGIYVMTFKSDGRRHSVKMVVK